jgi:hypothetical protein
MDDYAVMQARSDESIEKAMNSVSLTAIQQKGLPVGAPEALEAA